MSQASLSRLVQCNTSLLGLFVSYKESEMLWMQPQELNSEHFIFFITHYWAKKLECLSQASLSNLVECNISLLGLFISCEENEMVVTTAPGTIFRTLNFLHNSSLSPNSLNVCRWQTFSLVQCNSSLLGVFVSYKRKWNVANKDPGAIFTKLHFFITHQWAQKA